MGGVQRGEGTGRVAVTSLRAVVVLLLLTLPRLADARGERMTDDQVRQAMIAESVASYPSVCACPYSAMRNGRACGGRSAYSRPGGRSPLCYPQDITREMVTRWRSGR